MALWKFVPVAPKGSSYWQDQPIWREVVVRASSAAQARVVAGEMDRRHATDQVPVGNESHRFRSGFEDEKLYWVDRVSAADEPGLDPEGAEEVLRAEK